MQSTLSKSLIQSHSVNITWWTILPSCPVFMSCSLCFHFDSFNLHFKLYLLKCFMHYHETLSVWNVLHKETCLPTEKLWAICHHYYRRWEVTNTTNTTNTNTLVSALMFFFQVSVLFLTVFTLIPYILTQISKLYTCVFKTGVLTKDETRRKWCNKTETR